MEDAYIVSQSYLWLYFSSALSFKGAQKDIIFFLKMLLCLHRHWTEEMVLYVCFHGDAQKIYCQDCLRYSRNLFVWFITLFWCVIGILVTMLFILYINLGSSISFPLFISYYAVKKNLNKILTLKFIDSSPIKGRMLKETKYLKVIWKKNYLKMNVDV